MTYPFLDYNVINIIITLATIPIFGMLVENLYGRYMFVKFCVIVVVVTGIICAAIAAAIPFITGSLSSWFDVGVGGYFGFQPILMACFVACKQAMPESIIALAFVVRVKLKHMPILTLTLTLCAAIFLPSRGALPFAVALLVSWCYLRFFSSLQMPSAGGDLRDSFSFASFFPQAMQPWIAPVSRRIDGLRCWPGQGSALAAKSSGSVPSTLPAVAGIPMTQEARDHRAIAQELVNQRMDALERSETLSDVAISFDESASEVKPVAPSASRAEKQKE